MSIAAFLTLVGVDWDLQFFISLNIREGTVT